MRALIALLLTAGAVSAQGLRDGDARMDAAGMTDALSGQVVEFFDGSLARYGADGSYTYRYTPTDPEWIGTWEAQDDSRVCVMFENGRGRCDTYVRADGRLVLITSGGLRFPTREVRPEG